MNSSKTKKLQSLKAAIQEIEAGKPTLSFVSDKSVTEKKAQKQKTKRLLKDELEEVIADQEESPEKKAKKYALDCLVRREHGFIELLRKMKTKGFEEEVCEFALHQLKGEGSQSDARFTAAMIAHGAFKGQGPIKIRKDLQQKGLAGEIVNIAFESSEVDWYALVSEVRLKKYGSDVPKEWKDKAKQMRFLQSRGFEMGQINAAFDR